METCRIGQGLWAMGLGLLALARSAGADPVAERPETSRSRNILWIYPDQHRWDALGAAGNEIIQTPHLDRLAASGIRFAQHYTSSPMCVPSRISVLTGLHPPRTGTLINNHQYRRPWPGIPAFPQILAEAGYRTASAGKSHVSRHPHEIWQEDLHFALFPEVADYFRMGEDICEETYGILRSGNGAVIGGWYPEQPDGRHHVSHTVEMALEWLTGHHREFRDQPFLLRVSIEAPHFPILPPKSYYDRYDPADMPVPDHRFPPHAQFHQRYLNVHRIHELSEADIRHMWVSYYGLVSYVDTQVGRLMEKLEQLGWDEDTIIMYSSDHGELLGHHGLPFKGPMYEPAVRIPYIISAPGLIPAGRVHEGLTSTIDEGPTLLDLVGLAVPDSMDGRALLRDMDRPGSHERIFSSVALQSRYRVLVREDRYAMAVTTHAFLDDHRIDPDNFVADPEARDGILFDLDSDPQQYRNLYHDPEYREVRERLTDAIDEWLQATLDAVVR